VPSDHAHTHAIPPNTPDNSALPGSRGEEQRTLPAHHSSFHIISTSIPRRKVTAPSGAADEGAGRFLPRPVGADPCPGHLYVSPTPLSPLQEPQHWAAKRDPKAQMLSLQSFPLKGDPDLFSGVGNVGRDSDNAPVPGFEAHPPPPPLFEQHHPGPPLRH